MGGGAVQLSRIERESTTTTTTTPTQRRLGSIIGSDPGSAAAPHPLPHTGISRFFQPTRSRGFLFLWPNLLLDSSLSLLLLPLERIYYYSVSFFFVFLQDTNDLWRERKKLSSRHGWQSWTALSSPCVLLLPLSFSIYLFRFFRVFSSLTLE